MLLRMYRMYGEKQGWRVSEIDTQYGDGAGIKSATWNLMATFVCGHLKAESGVHRLVRISPIRFQCTQTYFFRLRICISVSRQYYRRLL